MSRIRSKIGCLVALITGLAALVGGVVCFCHYPWDMPVVAGHLGCMTVGVRIWVIELALLTTATVGLRDCASLRHDPARIDR
jgi:hypothetical protein